MYENNWKGSTGTLVPEITAAGGTCVGAVLSRVWHDASADAATPASVPVPQLRADGQALVAACRAADVNVGPDITLPAAAPSSGDRPADRGLGARHRRRQPCGKFIYCHA